MRDRRTRSQPGRILPLCAAAGACALLVAACGSAAAPDSGTSAGRGSGSSSAAAGSSGPATTATAKISLEVNFSGSPTTAAAHYTLRCDPAGGTVTDPASACAKLMRGTSLFGPLPAHVACPMIMADAGHATVSGSYLGRPVHETVIDGGCDLSRWAKLRQVFS
ncbi:MAG TPA: SSI family serine proteinase inhibitor [Streptosporangiaceae bacterium]|nr:SSI family serine proteinase inhibitor [Streptosporangiaceae bacterium]